MSDDTETKPTTRRPWALVELSTAVNDLEKIKIIASSMELVIIPDGTLEEAVRTMERARKEPE